MLALDPVAGERAVLRMMTEEPWRTHGAALTTRESEIQRMLAAGNPRRGRWRWTHRDSAAVILRT